MVNLRDASPSELGHLIRGKEVTLLYTRSTNNSRVIFNGVLDACEVFEYKTDILVVHNSEELATVRRDTLSTDGNNFIHERYGSEYEYGTWIEFPSEDLFLYKLKFIYNKTLNRVMNQNSIT